MSTKSLLTILGLAALAGCAEKNASAPAKTSSQDQPGATSVTPDTSAARAGALPPMPRHLGSDAPAAADDPPRRGDWPGREAMMARRQERQQEMLAKFDADHDGQLSDAERDTARQARVADMVTRMDTDHDGKLSQTELDAMRGGRRGGPDFATLDVDHDGFVTAAEMQAMRRPMRDRGPDDRGPAPDDDEAPPAK